MRKDRNRLFTGIVLLLTLTFSGCASDPEREGSDVISHTPTLVTVPKGTFKMGWDYLPGANGLGDINDVAPYTSHSAGPSGPVRRVTLSSDYEIGKYEITNSEYADMLNYALRKGYLSGDYRHNITVKNAEGNSQELLNLDADYEGKTCEIFFDGNKFVVKAGLESRPVVYVSWYGAAFYCNILGEWQGYAKLYNLADWSCTFDSVPRFYGMPGYRIPTEAEWEHAARYDGDDLSGKNLVYDRRAVPWESSGTTFGIASNNGATLAYFTPYTNYKSGNGTVDVGSFPSGQSLLGIHDLTGNVSEWAQDYYAPYSFFAPYLNEINPLNDTSGVYRQRRGGSWLVYANNFPLTTYHTDTNWAYTSYCDFGFRVVRVQ